VIRSRLKGFCGERKDPCDFAVVRESESQSANQAETSKSFSQPETLSAIFDGSLVPR